MLAEVADGAYCRHNDRHAQGDGHKQSQDLLGAILEIELPIALSNLGIQ